MLMDTPVGPQGLRRSEEQLMDGEEVYDTVRLKQLAVSLFYQWGYNFYRREKELRADDQLIRARASGLLGDARAGVEAAETLVRKEGPSGDAKERSFAEHAAAEKVRTLEGLVRSIDNLIGRLSAMPNPSAERMSERFRKEAQILGELFDCDVHLIGGCETLRSLVEGRSPAFILEHLGSLVEGVAGVERALRRRADVLR